MRTVLGSDSFGVLDRITAIFEAFDEDDQGLGISDLAMRSGLPKSTVSRLVAGLVRQRYLERDGKLVHLGLRVFELGQLAEKPQELRYAALHVMADLRSATGETVHLAIREGREMITIAIRRGRASAALNSRIGGRVPAHATALGRAVLAYAPATDVEALVSAGLTSWTPHTTIDPEQLMRQLAEVRRTGLAVEMREFVSDVASVASPVFSQSGDVVAAISVFGPADDFELDRSAPAVRTAALMLERRLALGGNGSA